jgi:hypothetical protein
VQFIGLAISAAGVVVPEADRIAARHINGGQCYVVTFSRDRSTAWMRPSEICDAPRRLAVHAH